MRLELVQATRPERVDPGVMPDVGSRAAVAPQLNVVEVGVLAHAEDADQFMLAAVERALAGIRLYPHREIEHLAVNHPAGFDELTNMAPVHAYVMNGTITRDRCSLCQRAFEERDEVRAGKLAGCHREFGVLDLATTHNVPDPDVVGRIQEAMAAWAPPIRRAT